jgi:hypothetical protein
MTQSILQDAFRDILKHTHSLGIYERVKIDNTDGLAHIEGINNSKDVILKGKLGAVMPGFEGHCVGLARLGVLDGYFKYEGFRDGGGLEVQSESSGEPKELKFVDARGTVSNYRFMKSDVISSQQKPIRVNEPTQYTISFNPSSQNIKDLVYFNSILGAFESSFSPKVENRSLYFYLGDNGGDRTKVLIADNIEGTFNHDMKWPLDIVLKIVRNGFDGGTVSLHIFNKGLLKITVTSAFGSEYNYFLPALG